MKRILVILAVCLLLTACGNNSQTAPSETTTEPTVTGLYDPDSVIEQQTGGAVKVYRLESGEHIRLASVGGKVLVIGEDGTVTVLTGEQGETEAVLRIEAALTDFETAFDTADTGIAYYDKANNQIVRLNPNLKQSAVYALPETMQGTPAVSLGTQEIYYVTGQELRALNMQSGISRLIRNYSGEMSFTSVHFDGNILACRVSDGQAEARTVYISTKTGQILSEDQQVFELTSCGDAYFAMRLDGAVIQQIFGTLEGQPKSLDLNADWSHCVAALPLNGVIGYVAEEAGLELSFYDLETGRRTAAVDMPNVGDPVAWHSDGTYVWILGYENEQQVLYRWDVRKSAVQEDTVFTGDLYTYQTPNTEGLAQCQSRVEAMNEAYGVRIRIWEEAVKQTGGYTMTAEHQVEPINKMLDSLETVLARFPEKFLQTTVKAGWIRICLVRHIDGGLDSVQYWAEGDSYIALSLDADVQTAFLMGLGYSVDSHVMGNSRDFDTWKDMNPQGFTYGQVNSAFLEGANRAFVDAESMENVYEDRSRMIAYAMMDGQEAVFASETMQNKLLRICKGIREAYGLEKSPETYFWEQYLNQSLAYTK